MNRHLRRWVLVMYPSAWRDRYGSEVVSLSEELIGTGQTTPLRAGLDLAAGAALERGRALARFPRSAPVLAAAAIMIVGGVAFTVIQTGSGPASAYSVSLNCFSAKPPGPAGPLGRTQSRPIAHYGQGGQGPARRRAACPGGQLRWVHHGSADTQPGVRALRFPPAGE
jgi:hypothetical protein